MRSLNLQRVFDKTLRHDDFVLVYQMGRVCTSSLRELLKKNNIPSWHIQTFDDCEEFLMYQNTDDVNYFFDWHIRTIYKVLLGHRCRVLQKRDYLKIISVIQEPIANLVSCFFEDLHIQFIEAKKTSAIHGDIEETMEFLIDAFNSQIRFNYFTDWYEKELLKNFHVDILSYINSPNKNYWRIEQSGRDILVLKYETIDKVKQEITHFLEKPAITTITDATKANKWYYELYKLFLKRYPFEQLFHIYQSPIYQAIYTKKEIEKFKKQWSTL